MNSRNRECQIKRVITPLKLMKDKKMILNSHLVKYIKNMKELNQELDFVFKYSHDGIVISDKNGVVLRCNDAYCRIMGIAAEDLIGKHPEEFSYKQRYLSKSATLTTIQTRKIETTMPLSKNGKKIMITSIPVFDENGDIFRVIANARDMTELINLKSQIEHIETLSSRYYSEILHLRSQDVKVRGVIAESLVMKNLIATALKVAGRDVTLLITGESGAGKEVLARAVHENSQVKEGPFVKVNCGAIPEKLLESELFGYEKGAFTSASKEGKPGIFEIAMGGTLFLDEIGEIPMSLQAKLLGVLQDMKFTRVGGIKEISLKARIIAATNRNLEEMIREKCFRKDLFYRLNVVGLKIPSLNERKDDIFPLANYFLNKLNKKYKTSNTLSPQVVNAFMSYEWPGNVREMENLVERLVVLAPNEQINIAMLPDSMLQEKDMNKLIVLSNDFKEGRSSLAKILEDVERKIFENLIAESHTSYKMAEILGINQSTVIRKIKKLGLKI